MEDDRLLEFRNDVEEFILSATHRDRDKVTRLALKAGIADPPDNNDVGVCVNIIVFEKARSGRKLLYLLKYLPGVCGELEKDESQKLNQLLEELNQLFPEVREATGESVDSTASADEGDGLFNTAALLIDWENLKIALLDGNYRFTTAELARTLRASAVALAKSVSRDLKLGHAVAFAPAPALDPRTNEAFRSNDIASRVTHGRQADIDLAIRAMQLRYIAPVTNFFIIVSGDADYLPLVEELNTGGSQCHIWAADEAHTSRSIRIFPEVDYVAKRLNLHSNYPSQPSEDDGGIWSIA